MIYGILLTIGVIAVIASRFFCALYGITLGGDTYNNFKGGFALFLDVFGTVLVAISIINVN